MKQKSLSVTTLWIVVLSLSVIAFASFIKTEEIPVVPVKEPKQETLELIRIADNLEHTPSAGFSNELSDSSTVTLEVSEAVMVSAPIEEPAEESVLEQIESESYLYVTELIDARVDPSDDAEVVGYLAAGDKVTVYNSIEDGWARVKLDKYQFAFVEAKFLSEESPLVKVSSTAYYDKYNRGSASGRRLVKGKSVAGRVSWLGRHAKIYRCNKDGSVGDLVGEYQFDDTGYGAQSGKGSSRICKGKTVGTIENGTCIDIFYNTESECYDWGRRNVYIQFVD